MTHITYADRGYIVLSDIELPGLPETVNVDGYDLKRKNEFHITLVGAKALTYLPQDGDAAQLMRDAVKEFAETHDITTYEVLDEYRLVRREDRVTIVALAKVAGMSALYDFLNEKFGTDLPTQPAHVTIYSLDPDVGISINSDEQLAETKIVSL